MYIKVRNTNMLWKIKLQIPKKLFEKLCFLVGTGYVRKRKDGVIEYIIGKTEAIREFLAAIAPYVILKKEQVGLMLEILDYREKVTTKQEFKMLMKMIDRFRELNYSKKRLKRSMIP